MAPSRGDNPFSKIPIHSFLFNSIMFISHLQSSIALNAVCRGIIPNRMVASNSLKVSGRHTQVKRGLYNNYPSMLLSQKDSFEESEISFSFDSFDKQGLWLTIDWDKVPISVSPEKSPLTSSDMMESQSRIAFSPQQPSPVQLSLVRDRRVYVKRDDLLHLRESNVSGNKARKMIALNELSGDQFPDVVVSYGGAQSNAMLAIAAIVNSKNADKNLSKELIQESLPDEIEDDSWLNDNYDDTNMKFSGDQEHESTSVASKPSSLDSKKRFIYYTKKLPRYLRKQPNGNLLRALTLGMEIVELPYDRYRELFGGDEGGSATPPPQLDPPVGGKSLWIPQGGANGSATPGAKLMASEIVQFWKEKGKGMPLTVCLPGGTCTTALLLSREVNALIDADRDKIDIQVAVIPCVGSEGYARRQMKALDLSTGGNGRDDIPKIFKPPPEGYFRFGEPSPAILQTFLEMKDEHDIYLDLLYGAPAWNLLLQSLSPNVKSPIQGRQMMYVHSGGLEGISSQLTRYKHKGLIDASQIQGY